MSPKKLNQLKEYLEKHKDLVLKGDYAELYRRLVYSTLYEEDLTEILYAAGINILETNIKCIPVGCYEGLDMSKLGLSTLKIPLNIERVRSSAFGKTKKLNRVIIPEGCDIGPSAFERSVDLREVIFTGNGTEKTHVAEDAFDGCDSLQRIVIPRKVCGNSTIPVGVFEERGIKVELR